MTQKGLDNFFSEYLEREPLFDDKSVLQSNYTPETLDHRDAQIKQIADMIAPILRLQKPSNLFVYGKTGTGKTVSISYTTNKILEISKKKDLPIKTIYVNCKLKRVADTEYRLIAELARGLGKEIPATGLPTDEVYNIFYKAIEEKSQRIILILDEIDQLVKKAGDEILYNLTRINSELKESQVSLIGISNDLLFADNLDPRVKSSLSEEEIVFPPYNALQLQEILKQRAERAFKKGTLMPGVIEKCSALAAREHGDARRALELLRISGEIAERQAEDKVDIKHIDMAEEKIERDRLIDIVNTQPRQFQVTLYSILNLTSKSKNMVFTGEIYELYRTVCKQTGLLPLTQRRISDIIAELDMLGIITARVISKGRFGRTREITLAIPQGTIPKVMKMLNESLDLKDGNN